MQQSDFRRDGAAQLISGKSQVIQGKGIADFGRDGARQTVVEQIERGEVGVVEKGGSVSVRDGDEVVLEYECELLNGVKVYDSRRDGLLRIRVGEDSEVPLGLQLAVRHLNLNSLARVIVPYNLAYGLSGDGNRIPKSATLVYTLKVKEIK